MENQNDQQPQQHTLNLNWSPGTDEPLTDLPLTTPESVTKDTSTEEPVDTAVIENDIVELEGNLTAIEETEFADEPSPFNKELVELTEQLAEAFEETTTETKVPHLEEENDETDEPPSHLAKFAEGHTPDYSEDDLSAIPLIHSTVDETKSVTDLPTDKEISHEDSQPTHTNLTEPKADIEPNPAPTTSSVAEPVTLPVTPKNKFIFMNKETSLAADQINSEPTGIDLNECGDTIGGRLKAGRLSRKLSFLDIEETTKIKKGHIINLENNRFDLLPAPVYTRAYIRKLSIAYSIIPDELVGMYNEKINNTRRQHPVTKVKLPNDDGCVDDANPEGLNNNTLKTPLTPTLLDSNKSHSKLTKKIIIAIPVVLALILIGVLTLSGGKDSEPGKNTATVHKPQADSNSALDEVLKRAKKPTIEPEVMDIPTYQN